MSSLRVREKVAYGFGDLASNLVFAMLLTFSLFFYTDVFGIGAAAAGTLLLVARVWSGASDVIFGVLADKVRTRWGRYRPWLLWLPIPLAVAGVFAFFTPDIGLTAKLVYAYITYIVAITLYTAINVPYGVLIAVMTRDFKERNNVSGYRLFFALVGALIVSVATLPLVELFGGDDPQLGYTLVMVLFGAIAVVLFYATFYFTRERVEPPPRSNQSLIHLFDSLKGNWAWVIVALLGFFGLLAIGVRNASVLFYMTYNVGDQSLTSWFLGSGLVAALISAPSSVWLTRWFSKSNTAIVGLIIAVGAGVAWFFVPASSIALVFILNAVASFGTGVAITLWPSMLSDTVDYSEWKTGKSEPGLIYSAGSLLQKVGIGISAVVVGVPLAISGYVADAATQTDTALFVINLLQTLLPSVVLALAVVFLLFYRLDSNLHTRIKDELVERAEKA